jgi:hypothetical protein
VEGDLSSGAAIELRDHGGRVLAGLGAGVLLALGAGLIGDSGRATGPPELQPPGPVAAWAVDRGAQELCELDADLLLVRSVRLGWPVAVRARADGGAWVLRSKLGSPASPSILDRIRADGSIAAEVELGACTGLALLASGDAVVIEKRAGSGGSDRLVRCGDEGRTEILLEALDLACAAETRSGVLAGTRRGEILRVTPQFLVGPIPRTTLAGAVFELAPGPEPDEAWVLFGEGGGSVGLLDAGLELRWSAPTGLRSARAGAVVGEQRIWIVDAERSVVRRFGPGGKLELECADLPIPGAERVVSWRDGGVLLVSPGAILRLDRRGRLLPGQGGFDYLADLDRP